MTEAHGFPSLAAQGRTKDGAQIGRGRSGGQIEKRPRFRRAQFAGGAPLARP